MLDSCTRGVSTKIFFQELQGCLAVSNPMPVSSGLKGAGATPPQNRWTHRETTLAPGPSPAPLQVNPCSTVILRYLLSTYCVQATVPGPGKTTQGRDGAVWSEPCWASACSPPKCRDKKFYLKGTSLSKYLLSTYCVLDTCPTPRGQCCQPS